MISLFRFYIFAAILLFNVNLVSADHLPDSPYDWSGKNEFWDGIVSYDCPYNDEWGWVPPRQDYLYNPDPNKPNPETIPCSETEDFCFASDNDDETPNINAPDGTNFDNFQGWSFGKLENKDGEDTVVGFYSVKSSVGFGQLKKQCVNYYENSFGMYCADNIIHVDEIDEILAEGHLVKQQFFCKKQ